ncbi:unnamed protein product [Caenorhabditis angaria]|uniref:Gelsolin-like domain-containing protein n=1 Tax=Caenorhabditis angaria TaxID=860376 RepID=A0A9P1N6E4_9PELO|nr:unnamed protein product [Caenorhabditis angaria]
MRPPTTDPALKDIANKLGLTVWRINKFELELVPELEYGIFYNGDAYIALNQKYEGYWDVHFWLGKNASTDEIGVAAIKTVEIDDSLGGIPVQHREVQDHESPLFLSYFSEGVRYVSGGYESGYNHVTEDFKNFKPRLFHCKGKRNVRCTEVQCDTSALNLGDVFILDLGKDIYVWMPPESGRLERIKGMSRAKNIAHHERQGASSVHILDADGWNSDPIFWSYFGGPIAVKYIQKAKDDDENYWKRLSEQITLWKVSDATGDLKVSLVSQGEDIKKSQLDSNDAFILDALNGGIFVWIGKNCTLDERSKALIWGQNYLKQHHLPSWTQVTRVLDTTENTQFTQWFHDWVDDKKKNTFDPLLFQVSDESGLLRVEEIANFTQEDLDGDDVMILDALNSIYVWVGANANPNEKKEALNTAKSYLEKDKLPRHQKTTIETIYQGQEGPTFKKFFPSWDDKLFKNEVRTVENMRRLLFN